MLLTVLGLVPGLPFLPFVALAGAMAGIGYALPRRARQRQEKHNEAQRQEQLSQEEEERNSVKSSLKTAEIELLIGKQLSTRLLASHQELAYRMGKMRKKFAAQYGFVVPEVRLTDDYSIPPKSYRIKIHGTVVTEYQMRVGELLVLVGNNRMPDIPGEEVKEPAFGMRAFSVPEMFADDLKRERYALPTTCLCCSLI